MGTKQQCRGFFTHVIRGDTKKIIGHKKAVLIMLLGIMRRHASLLFAALATSYAPGNTASSSTTDRGVPLQGVTTKSNTNSDKSTWATRWEDQDSAISEIISNYSLIRRKNSFLFHHHQDNIPISPHIPPKCMLTYLLHTKMLIPAYTISFKFWMAATYCISGKKNSLFYTSKRAWWTALLDGYLLGWLPNFHWQHGQGTVIVWSMLQWLDVRSRCRRE